MIRMLKISPSRQRYPKVIFILPTNMAEVHPYSPAKSVSNFLTTSQLYNLFKLTSSRYARQYFRDVFLVVAKCLFMISPPLRHNLLLAKLHLPKLAL